MCPKNWEYKKYDLLCKNMVKKRDHICINQGGFSEYMKSGSNLKKLLEVFNAAGIHN